MLLLFLFAFLLAPWQPCVFSWSVTMMPSGNKSSNDNISHSAALRESRGGSEEGEPGVAWGRGGGGARGRPCVFDRSVFVDDFSASPPMLTEVDCAGGGSENSCFWHTLCKECVCHLGIDCECLCLCVGGGYDTFKGPKTRLVCLITIKIRYLKRAISYSDIRAEKTTPVNGSSMGTGENYVCSTACTWVSISVDVHHCPPLYA